MSGALIHNLENIHPSLWRASQLARGVGEFLDCGYPALARELPGGGWPTGALTELLLEQAGSAELQLLRPALANLQHGRIALLQTPYQPQLLALAALEIDLARLLWLRCANTRDALWAAEQVLKNGSCSALLFWQNQIKADSLRRLHLAAQTGRTLFCLIRPWEAQQSPSPAPLRIKLSLSALGLQLDIVKRRGAQQAQPTILPFAALSTQFSPYLIENDYAKSHATATNSAMDSDPSSGARRGNISPALVAT